MALPKTSSRGIHTPHVQYAAEELRNPCTSSLQCIMQSAANHPNRSFTNDPFHSNDMMAPRTIPFLAHPFRQVIHDRSIQRNPSTTNHTDTLSPPSPISSVKQRTPSFPLRDDKTVRASPKGPSRSDGHPFPGGLHRPGALSASLPNKSSYLNHRMSQRGAFSGEGETSSPSPHPVPLGRRPSWFLLSQQQQMLDHPQSLFGEKGKAKTVRACVGEIRLAGGLEME
ncbi:hypothetical protein AVEN_59234-1 [Araneus ventricosus]|uniref:Uncharacterized protein n=1 Tax=Araneus ventricosus TaxID=182803 RepID=A0A4Y2CZV8_ARAVE|nr:hypothetical protein AVEN_59234-1 [Araneus ventricosus]